MRKLLLTEEQLVLLVDLLRHQAAKQRADRAMVVVEYGRHHPLYATTDAAIGGVDGLIVACMAAQPDDGQERVDGPRTAEAQGRRAEVRSDWGERGEKDEQP